MGNTGSSLGLNINEADVSYTLKNNLPASMAIAAFFGLSWYIAIELFVHMCFSFRWRISIYQISCMASTVGIFLSPLFNLLKDYGIAKNQVAAMIAVVFSWWIMVIPQSVMVYSRLHLVQCPRKWLLAIRGMLIFTTVAVSIPTMVLSILSRTVAPKELHWYSIWEKVQISIFFAQEMIIAGVYIYQTNTRRKNIAILHNKRRNEVYYHLILTSCLVIFLNITLQVLSFIDVFLVVNAYKVAVYAVKLRCEFSILNRLIESVQSGGQSGNTSNIRYSPAGAPQAALNLPDAEGINRLSHSGPYICKGDTVHEVAYRETVHGLTKGEDPATKILALTDIDTTSDVYDTEKH